MNDRAPSDFETWLRLLEDCRLAILCDPKAWLVEAGNHGARPLAWPRPVEGRGYKRFVAWTFNELVEGAMQAMRESDEPAELIPPMDPMDPVFQVVLRLAQRTIEEWDKRVVQEFRGLVGPISGRREFLKALKLARVHEAVRSGLPRGEALKRLQQEHGISRAAAYRRMHGK